MEAVVQTKATHHPQEHSKQVFIQTVQGFAQKNQNPIAMDLWVCDIIMQACLGDLWWAQRVPLTITFPSHIQNLPSDIKWIVHK